jgi:hypothetical protein
MTIEVRGFRLFDDDGRSNYNILAIAGVTFVEIGLELRGCKLVQHYDGNYSAHAPSAKIGHDPLVKWERGNKIEVAVRRALLKAFEAEVANRLTKAA